MLEQIFGFLSAPSCLHHVRSNSSGMVPSSICSDSCKNQTKGLPLCESYPEVSRGSRGISVSSLNSTLGELNGSLTIKLLLSQTCKNIDFFHLDLHTLSSLKCTKAEVEPDFTTELCNSYLRESKKKHRCRHRISNVAFDAFQSMQHIWFGLVGPRGVFRPQSCTAFPAASAVGAAALPAEASGCLSSS